MDREHRLRKGSEFDSVYSKGTVVGGPLVVLRHLPNEIGRVRWGFAVGKKMARHSVDRNRLKRQLRESARQLRIEGSCDLIITARPAALGAGHAALVAALAKGITRSGVARVTAEA